MSMYRKVNARKALMVLVSALLVLSLLSACSKSGNSGNNAGTPSNTDTSANTGETKDPTQTGNNKPYDGVVLNVGVEAGGPAPEYFKSILGEFKEKTGITVNIMDVPGQNMHDRFVTEAISGTGGFDVYNLDQPWIPEFADKGFLEPIDKIVTQEMRDDYFPSALETVTYKGKIYGLPYLVHSPIIYYRTDLFAKAGLTAPPKTLEEYREYAKKLTDPANDIYGTIMEGQQSAEPVTQFTDMVLQHGGKLLDENNKVMVDSPEVIDAFKYMLGIQYEDKSSPPGAVNYSNTEVLNLFMQGKVAMVRNWPYMYSMAKDPANSKVAGKFAVASQPGTNAVWSWNFGVASTSKNKDAAIEFVKWASSPDVIVGFAKKVINPVPSKSALEKIKADTSLAKEDIDAITFMTNTVEQGQSVALNQHYDSFRNRLAISLSKIMTKQATPEQEMKSAGLELQQIADGK
jgi:multiple sugar transport system substrate-binding protein